jgi:hypothetical protein
MANVTIPDLTAITTPGATTVIEVADPAATPVSRKMTLANAIINGLEDASLVAFTDTSGALSVESSVADGPTAVAVAIDTATALADGDAKLLTVANNGDVKVHVGPGGATTIKELVTVVDASVATTTSNFYPSIWSMDTASASPIYIDPQSGASATAYTFDTTVEHTSGLLLDLLNDGTSKFSVTFAGRIIAPSAPPANASAAGVAGSITWDSGFIYICTATNTWKRVAIATW